MEKENRGKTPTPEEIKKALEEAMGGIFATFPPEKNEEEGEEKDGKEKNAETEN